MFARAVIVAAVVALAGSRIAGTCTTGPAVSPEAATQSAAMQADAPARPPETGGVQPEPDLLRKIIAAGWQMSKVQSSLPPVEAINELEYAYDGGALRLNVAQQGGRIYSLVADTRRSRYAEFAHLSPAEGYNACLVGPYGVVVRVQPIGHRLFDRLKGREWTRAHLRRSLGPPTFIWSAGGGVPWFTVYVPQGLTFVESPDQPGTHYLVNPLVTFDTDNVPRAERVRDYLRMLRPRCSGRGSPSPLLKERREIAKALARGKRSPDGRFVVGQLNLGGSWHTQEFVIKETGKAERRYFSGHSIGESDYRWLNRRTILFRLAIDGVEFYTLDAITGRRTLTAKVEPAPYYGPTQFAVQGPRKFWYRTEDGKTHEVTVK